MLRKDIPITFKAAIPKEEQKKLDNELEDFLKSMTEIELKLQKDGNQNEELPPVRSSAQLVLNGKSATKVPVVDKTKSNKSAKPKDYREWEKYFKSAFFFAHSSSISYSYKISSF